MKIGVLTSSRADYGIYLPLLMSLKEDSFFELEIIAFGTHLSKAHGFTVYEILKDNYNCVHQITSLLSNDDEQSISTAYGLTVLKFADFWKSNKYNLVFCLGDRFEMSAAVQSGIPFGVKFAHIHGGETTLGAFDNIYRHQITHASMLHFTAHEIFSQKVSNLIDNSDFIYNVGSLSLDGIENFKPISKRSFYDKFKISYDEFLLVTLHPETIEFDLNKTYSKLIKDTLADLTKDFFLLITMPNADTMGSVYREDLLNLQKEFPEKITCVENLGKENYFSAMYYAKIMIGNTSSGILEAASFRKYVINLGNRQKGRLQSENVHNLSFHKSSIISKVKELIKLGDFKGSNLYHQIGSAKNIINILKKY